MGKASSPGETLARKVIGGLLWGVSAALSINLFLSFSGGDLIKVLVLGAMAVGLEGAKILTWKSGGSQKILASVLIGLSVLASFGAALQTVRTNDRDVSRVESSTHALDKQIRDLEERISNLPPTWLTWYRTLSADLEKLRESRENMEFANAQDSGPNESSLFRYIADFFQWDQFWLELGVLMVMAVALEWGAIQLLGTEAPSAILRKSSKPSSSETDPEVFLQKMVSLGDGIYLAGRDRVGKALNWPPYRAKKSFNALVKKGTIERREGRMVLSSLNPN